MVALYTTKYYSSIFKKKKKIIQVVHCGLLHQGIFCLFKENYKKKDNHVHMLFWPGILCLFKENFGRQLF